MLYITRYLKVPIIKWDLVLLLGKVLLTLTHYYSYAVLINTIYEQPYFIALVTIHHNVFLEFNNKTIIMLIIPQHWTDYLSQMAHCVR